VAATKRAPTAAELIRFYQEALPQQPAAASA
jgi:hypothetical protein